MNRRLAGFLVVCACQRTETVTRVVNLHLAACTIPDGSFGEYVATGDYDPPALNHSSLLTTDEAGVPIDGVPANVQSLALAALPPDGTSWNAMTLVAAAGDVDMLLLPAAQSCALTTKIGAGGAAANSVIGLIDPQTLLVIGTSTTDGHAFRVDLTTGVVSKIEPDMKTPRSAATVTPFGQGLAIAAGGLNAGNILLGDAEIYDPVAKDFTQSIKLTGDRAQHGAVTLASGDVLLVGGVGDSGELDTIERIDASTLTSAPSGNLMSGPRANPTVMTLADGTILVGGGTRGGLPVGGIDFIALDGTVTTTASPTFARSSFAALAGGGALVVGTSGPGTNAAGLISHGAFVAIDDPTLDAAALTDVKLVSNSNGALLWTGATWLAFDLWKGTFDLVANSPSGPDLDSPVISPDSGSRVWVADDGTLRMWRDDVRNEFSTEGPYLSADLGTQFMAPSGTEFPFDMTSGLLLSDNSQEVFVSDARYLDVTIDVHVPASSPPLVILRTGTSVGDIEVGGQACPYVTVPVPSDVHVTRQGSVVTLTYGNTETCLVNGLDPTTRVAIGLRGSRASNTVVSALDLRVTRVAPAQP